MKNQIQFGLSGQHVCKCSPVGISGYKQTDWLDVLRGPYGT